MFGVWGIHQLQAAGFSSVAWVAFALRNSRKFVAKQAPNRSLQVTAKPLRGLVPSAAFGRSGVN
jgi:hypothetical protein